MFVRRVRVTVRVIGYCKSVVKGGIWRECLGEREGEGEEGRV
jgi:hypothetical protein